MKQVKFKEWDCVVRLQKYENGRPALVLNDAEDGSPIAVASVNIPELPLASDYILIKDYSENEGMLEALEEAGIVSDTGVRIQSGFVEVPLCNLLMEEE